MFKTIMVHFAGTKADETVFLEAVGLARACGAHLECTHVRPGLGQLVNIAAGNAVGLGVEPNIGELLEALKDGAAERAAAARGTFAILSKAQSIRLAEKPDGGGLSANFVEKTGNEIEILIEGSRGHDAVIVAGGGSKGGLRAGDSARLLVESGRPLILTPSAKSTAAGGNALGVAAIAWKPTPESSRAIAAAIPLLTKAKKVIILTASEGSYDADRDEARTLSSYLAWHGINAETKKVLAAGRSSSEAVLDAVRDARADMLVMGAYGRGRLSEIVFPVFLLH